MAEPLTLMGYGPSVYTRIVRLALIEMGLSADYIEVDPFAATPDPSLLALNPIGRVPVLRHGDFVLSETSAILRYLDRISDAPGLIPADAKAAARMAQVIGIVDAHLYLPLVRKAFVYGFEVPQAGRASDTARVAEGISEAAPALEMLDQIAGEGLQLNGSSISLADLHLVPMIDCGLRVSEVQHACAPFAALMGWWAAISQRASVVQTDPLASP